VIETVVILTDDIDGKTRANVETVRFMIDGTEYELELGALNRRRLAETLQQYIDHGRRAANGTKPAGTSANGSRHVRLRAPRYPNTEVREWAKARGIPVRDRGRISAETADQYHAWRQAQAS
jgi:hypothetical protein